MKIAYARVSTSEQNLDMQLEWFKQQGCEMVFKEKRTAFKELPELEKALTHLRPGDILYIWALDRIGRKVLEILLNVQAITERKSDLVTYVGGIDTRNEYGKVLLYAFAMVAELEINLKKERTKAGILVSGRKGGRKPGITAEAMKKAVKAKKLYLSENPHYSVREICELANVSLKTLYKYLRIVGIEPGTSNRKF